MEKYAANKKLIRFGMPPVLSIIFWPNLFPLFQHYFPSYSFKLTTETRSTLKEMLTNNLLDVAILPYLKELPLPNGFHSKDLGIEENLMVTMSTKHPLASKDIITWEELADCNLLGYEGSNSLQQILEKQFAAIGRTLVFKQLCPQVSTMISLVRKNVGICILNGRIIQEFKDLVSIPVKDFKSTRFSLIWQKEYNGFHMLKELPELVTQVAQNSLEKPSLD